ncbi:hypothetical protein C457_15357 [Haloferax prahovense DSM 18310]|uniref:DUF1616 domain-containing protein n=1 Tax=Haloferax prahovense (strain DSM 18310 / JCM 13924 / TL6) TaxID=1227461 RepID=M0G303_HALPT|nr:DUF1616 domain-containing protein [Haloferax prahovense]ELZ65948.1 hypothetical protein C457_15357 [Haloferax prahovense DSM 18310]
MPSDTDWLSFVPRSVRTTPADLLAVVVVVVLTCGAVTVPGVRDTPLRIVLGLPCVLFVPGYAVIAALFPEAGPSVAADGDADAADRTGIDGIERVALSFGTSIAVVSLLGLLLNFTPWGLRLVPIVVSIGALTVVAAVVGSRRRAALPEGERFGVTVRSSLPDGPNPFSSGSRTDAAFAVVLVLCLAVAVGVGGYMVAAPGSGESFSEVYVLTENQSGQLAAEDYPTEFTAGEPTPLTVVVGNHEGTQTDYVVVSQLQRVRVANNTTTVLERESLTRYRPSVDADSTWRTEHAVTPTMTGDRLRLTYLLYEGTAPAEPTAENAAQAVHLWVNVTDSNSESS